MRKKGIKVKKYKVSVMRLGQAVLEAGSKEEAERLAGKLEPEQIHWYTEREGLSGPYVITLVEEIVC